MLALGSVAESVVTLLATLGIVILPGYCVAARLLPDIRNTMIRIGIGTAVGMGFPALVTLWLGVFGAKWWGLPLVLVYVSVGAAGAIWVTFRDGTRLRYSPSLWPRLLLVVILTAATYSRLYATRDMDFGQLGDSLQHTVVAQLFVDNRGMFSEWAPFGPMVSFTYHFGFHIVAAMFHWLTGLPVARSVVLVGQSINILTILVAYSGATLLFRGRSRREDLAEWGGLIACLVPAFLNTQPAYYVNWGRYTQLAGQVILPIMGPLFLTLLSARRLEKSDGWIKPALLVGLLLAGLLLTHYRVALFAASFALTSTAVGFVQWRDRKLMVSGLLVVAVSVVIALALTVPWILNTVTGKLPSLYAGMIQRSDLPVTGSGASFALPQMSPFYLKTWIAVAAGVAVLLGARARYWPVVHAFAWTIGLLAFPMLYLLALPGAQLIDWFSVYIALYIPLAFLFGFLGVWVAETAYSLGRRALRISLTLIGALTLLAVSWGLTFQPYILDESRGRMVSAADVQAFDWIKRNTNQDDSFLISGFPCFGGLLCGNDAGWWLNYATGRTSSIPPLPYATEATQPVDYKTRLQAIYGGLRKLPPQDDRPMLIDLTTPESLRLLRERRFGYVFIGDIRFPEASDRFNQDALASSPDFALVFASGNARVFAIKSQP